MDNVTRRGWETTDDSRVDSSPGEVASYGGRAPITYHDGTQEPATLRVSKERKAKDTGEAKGASRKGLVLKGTTGGKTRKAR